jgi:hypothetical protein
MVIRLRADWRACLLDSSQPGSLVHDVLAGAPVISRPGDAAGGLYEIDCSGAECQELLTIAARYCPEALGEIKAAIGRGWYAVRFVVLGTPAIGAMHFFPSSAPALKAGAVDLVIQLAEESEWPCSAAWIRRLFCRPKSSLPVRAIGPCENPASAIRRDPKSDAGRSSGKRRRKRSRPDAEPKW